jgi:putative mRNA 3-end processing factor
MTTVRLGDGVRITLGSGREVVADASDPDGAVAVLSHAHGDHLCDDPPDAVVASELSRELARVRRNGPVPESRRPDWIDLLPARPPTGTSSETIYYASGSTGR